MILRLTLIDYKASDVKRPVVSLYLCHEVIWQHARTKHMLVYPSEDVWRQLLETCQFTALCQADITYRLFFVFVLNLVKCVLKRFELWSDVVLEFCNLQLCTVLPINMKTKAKSIFCIWSYLQFLLHQLCVRRNDECPLFQHIIKLIACHGHHQQNNEQTGKCSKVGIKLLFSFVTQRYG